MTDTYERSVTEWIRGPFETICDRSVERKLGLIRDTRGKEVDL